MSATPLPILTANVAVKVNRALGLQCLISSRDAAIGRNFSSALLAAGVGSQVQLSSDAAFERLQRDRFDLVVVDCDDIGGLELLQLARKTASNQQTVVLAVASPKNTRREIYQGGATMVLQKPVTARSLATTLQTVMGKMQRERRRTFRMPVEIPVLASLDGGPPLRLTAVNISEEGMGLHGSVPLPPQRSLHLEFKLPGKTMVTIGAIVIWSDLHGRSGIRFEKVASTSLATLGRWLEERFEQFIHELQAAPSPAADEVAVLYH